MRESAAADDKAQAHDHTDVQPEGAEAEGPGGQLRVQRRLRVRGAGRRPDQGLEEGTADEGAERIRGGRSCSQTEPQAVGERAEQDQDRAQEAQEGDRRNRGRREGRGRRGGAVVEAVHGQALMREKNTVGTLSSGPHKLAIAIVTLAVLCFVPSALAGQIVYLHGGDLWAMSDAGGGAHQLATAAQI